MSELTSQFFFNLQQDSSSPAYAAIKTLAEALSKSNQQTIQGFLIELQQITNQIIQISKSIGKESQRRPISVQAGCDMFRYHANKLLIESDYQQFPKLKNQIVFKGLNLASMRPHFIQKISEACLRCFKDSIVILIHGYSYVVSEVLKDASSHFHISVLITECRPFGEGVQIMNDLKDTNVNCRLILDSSVASVMESVDIVIVGAEAIVESGGVINRIGTYSSALIAKAFRKPFYVLAESMKFARLYPLTQRDLPENKYRDQEGYQTEICDFTPPSLITLIITDLGILTPSAISDQLIQLYNS